MARWVEALLRRFASLRALKPSAFAAGLVATVPFLILTLLLRFLGLGVFLPEVAVEAVALLLPGATESFLIQALGEGAKYLGLVIALLVVTLLHGFVALWYPMVKARVDSRYATMGIFVLLPLAIALLVALPLLGAGVAGASTPQGTFAATFGLALGYLLFAAVLDYLHVDFRSKHPQGFALSRRGFLKLGAALVVGMALTALGLQWLASRPGRTSYATLADLEARQVTPNDQFYIVSKNVMDPTVDATSWRLKVGGAVERAMEWDYDGLYSMMEASQYTTLECVSNEVGGNLISNAQWRGVRLSTLMAAAGVRPEATWVAFGCADGYTVGIPLALALDHGTLVALEMNGVPPPQRHGFPARVVVPGRYGMFHAKWITSITLVTEEFLGFWQGKGWTNKGEVKTTAIILTPPPESVVSGTVALGGIAFSGRRGISRVEVSTDGGATWSEATLREPLSPFTWVLWSLEWAPSEGGTHKIIARAYDGDGTPQVATQGPPFPEGASGYDTVRLLVSP